VGEVAPQAARGLQKHAFLASQDLLVLRFDDLQVLKEIEGVMEVIVRANSGSLEGNPP
jgi:very-short-patch-repair endonuclease